MAAKMFEFSPDGGRIFSEGTASSKKALNRTCRQVNIMIELYNARVLPITNNDGWCKLHLWDIASSFGGSEVGEIGEGVPIVGVPKPLRIAMLWDTQRSAHSS